MTKRTYKDFRISELDGGINTRDAVTEIQDKQGVSIINWNFKGNRLVNSKGLKEKYVDVTNGASIKGILAEGDDIYHAAGGKFYKNGVEQTISIGTLPDKKCYISIWWDLVFFTFDDGTEPPYYLDGTTLTSVAGVGNPRYNIIYNGKWVLGGFGNDNIFFSKTATPTARLDIVDFAAYSAGSQSVGGDSKGLLTGFKIGENGLYVFKQDAAYYTNSEKDTGTAFNFIFNKISSNGAVNQNAIAEVEQEIFYYDGINKRVRRLGYEQNLTTLRDTAVSNEIDLGGRNLADDQSEAVMSFKYPNMKVFLKSRLVGTGVNDIIFSYNVENKSWSQETNKDCSVGSKGFLGSPYKTTVFEDDFGSAILSSNMEGEYISKAYAFGDPIDFKKFGEIELAGNIDQNVTLTIDVYVDAELIDSRTIVGDQVKTGALGTRTLGASVLGADMTQPKLAAFTKRIELFDSGQTLQFVLSYSGIGEVEISNVNIRFKRDLAFTNYS